MWDIVCSKDAEKKSELITPKLAWEQIYRHILSLYSTLTDKYHSRQAGRQNKASEKQIIGAKTQLY